LSPDESEDADEQLLSALAAWDEALAAGASPTDALEAVVPPALRLRLAGDVACLERLQHLRRRPASAIDTPRELSEVATLVSTSPPRSLGRFQIRRELGRGGFGVVFLAFDPLLSREVALKVPRAEALITPDLSVRFRHEALAAARLDHPNIVPVYEAGEAGPVAYIASAYCPGQTLAAWLKQSDSPRNIREAAALVAALAHAVHHAHSRGVLHRDLKPSNVLLEPVVGEPGYVPRVTDFGLAKLFGAEPASADPECRTVTGVALGTPGYMAPEQVTGKAGEVTTAADVYALGVILYELLVGRPPFQGATPLETMEQVRTLEPVPVRRLRADVPRDLETICSKCLQKDPGRRYAGAHELADDLKRFLTGEPVLARPVGAWERGWKWARRRPVAAALVGVSAVAIAGAIVGGLWHNSRLNWYNRELEGSVRNEQAKSELATREWKRAEGNLDEAKIVVDDMLIRLGKDELAGVPHMERVRRDLLERALTFYQTILNQRREDPALRRDTARAYYQVGYIQNLLGNHAAAIPAFDEAIALWGQLGTLGPGDPDVPGELVDALNYKGDSLKKLGQLPAAAAAHRDAHDRLEQSPNSPGGPRLRHKLAVTLNHLAVATQELGDVTEAERMLRRALDLNQEVLASAPTEPDYRESLANGQGNLGQLVQRRGSFNEAEACHRRAIELYRSLADEFPMMPTYRRHLAAAFGNLGMTQKSLGRIPDAEDSDSRAIKIAQQLVADFPQVPDYRKDLAQHRYNQGVLLRAAGRPKDAEQTYRAALPDLEWLIDRAPNVPEYRQLIAATLNNLYVVLQQRNDLAEARRCIEIAIRHLQRARELNPRNPVYHVSLANYHRNHVGVILQLKDHAAGADAAAALAKVDPGNPAVRFDAARYLAWCIRVADADAQLAADKRAQLARDYGNQAIAELKEAIRLGVRDPQQIKSHRDLEPLRQREDFQQLVTLLPTGQ